MTMGSASVASNSGKPYQSSTILPSSNPPSANSPSIATIRTPSPPLITSTPLMPRLDTHELSSSSNAAANLVKPSTFFALPPASSPVMMLPVSSSMPTAAPLHPSGNLQRPYGAPLLQPFPPPTPPPSLTPSPSPSPAPAPALNFGPTISRERVRDALLMLVQVSPCVFMTTCLSIEDLKSVFE
ncbi:hypothetical protein RJ639_010298 [Escallonia herrerae]|uniref:Uncharacterized protein n=1 Tax=Escallonia herrerae TaxID=1293975 RepID=A0AA88VV49_9ASTE|nr:hypothetical protein RJ639_010298 [Escallonia herrerae]